MLSACEIVNISRCDNSVPTRKMMTTMKNEWVEVEMEDVGMVLAVLNVVSSYQAILDDEGVNAAQHVSRVEIGGQQAKVVSGHVLTAVMENDDDGKVAMASNAKNEFLAEVMVVGREVKLILIDHCSTFHRPHTSSCTRCDANDLDRVLPPPGSFCPNNHSDPCVPSSSNYRFPCVGQLPNLDH